MSDSNQLLVLIRRMRGPRGPFMDYMFKSTSFPGKHPQTIIGQARQLVAAGLALTVQEYEWQLISAGVARAKELVPDDAY